MSAESNRQLIQSNRNILLDWLRKIDNYEIEEKDSAGRTIEDPEQSHQRVVGLLENKEAVEELYSGIDDNHKKAPNKADRIDFVTACFDEILLDPNTDFPLMCSSKKMRDIDKNSYIPDSENDPRKNKPEECTISMRDLLGEKGLELFKKAIKEEGNSVNFRDAVFLESTKHYKGPKWKNRLVLWIGGPSASGKSFNALHAVQKIGETVMEKIDGNENGNHVVSIDGGKEREISQMRQLVLQLALKKGYTGIKDLHKYAKLSVKTHVENAALATQNLSLVIPDTFSKIHKGLNLARYDNLDNTKAIFTEIVGTGPYGEFQDTVFRMGNSRAWSEKFSKEHTEDRKITVNNRDIKCESKKYDAEFFHMGVLGSILARKKYINNSKDKIYVPIINDLIHVRLDNDNKWVICEEKYKGKVVRLSKRDFLKWEKHVQNGYETAEIPMTNNITDLEAWLKILNTSGQASKPNISVIDFKARKNIKYKIVENFDYIQKALKIVKKPGIGSNSLLNDLIKENPIYFMWHYPTEQIKAKKSAKVNNLWKRIDLEKILKILNQNYPPELINALRLDYLMDSSADTLLNKASIILKQVKSYIQEISSDSTDNSLLEVFNFLEQLDKYLADKGEDEKKVIQIFDMAFNSIVEIYNNNLSSEEKSRFLNYIKPATSPDSPSSTSLSRESSSSYSFSNQVQAQLVDESEEKSRLLNYIKPATTKLSIKGASNTNIARRSPSPSSSISLSRKSSSSYSSSSFSSQVQAQLADEADEIIYARISDYQALQGATEQIGLLGRIFDSKDNKDITPELAEWSKDVFVRCGIITDDNELNPIILNNSADFHEAITSIGRFSHHFREECKIYRSDTMPSFDDWDPETSTAYVRHKDSLYYLNYLSKDTVKVNVKDIRKFDEELRPGDERYLSQDELESIRNITNHKSILETYFLKSAFKNQNELQPWILDALPKETAAFFSLLLREIYAMFSEIAFDHSGNIQPWLKKAIGDDNIEAILSKHSAHSFNMNIKAAVMAALREALVNSIPFPTIAQDGSLHNPHAALKNFLLCTDYIINHQNNHLINLKNEIELYDKQRYSNIQHVLLIKKYLSNANKLLDKASWDPLIDTSTLFDSLSECRKINQERKDNQPNNIVSGKITTSPGEPLLNKAPNFFAYNSSQAQIVSTNTVKEPKIYSLKTEITFSNIKNENIGSAKLNQQIVNHKLVSNLQQISLDIPGTIAKTLKETFPAHVQPVNEIKEFLKNKFDYIKKNFHVINRESLKEALKEFSSEEHFEKIIDTIMIRYKNLTEQLDPHEDKSSNPYASNKYFPSDFFILTAKHHVDGFVTRKKINPNIVIKEAWDPHYVEAVQLYCAMKGYTCTNKSGWADVMPEKVAAFKSFYENRYSHLKLDYVNKATNEVTNSLFDSASILFKKNSSQPASDNPPTLNAKPPKFPSNSSPAA